MHRQMSALLSAGGTPGKLAQLGAALGDNGINIETIGGAEWRHFGPVTFIIEQDKGTDPDDQIATFAEIMQSLEFGWIALRTAEVELDDTPGRLGEASAVLGDADINVYNINVIGRQGNRAVVGFGIRPSQVVQAVDLLVSAGFTARRRPHPDDPAQNGDPQPPWWDRWDDRTEELLDELWDDPGVEMNDPRFWIIDHMP